MDKNIKNIVFDLGGVLVDLDFKNAINGLQQAGFANVKEQLQTFDQEGIFKKFELGEIDSDQFRTAIRENSTVTLTDEEVDTLWNSMLLEVPRKKLELILDLRSKYMVYLLSNTNAIHWDYVCKNAFNYRGFRVNDYFEETFLSYEMHLAKPDKAIFEKVLHEANLLPE